MYALRIGRGIRRKAALSAIGTMMVLAIFLNAETARAASCSYQPIRNLNTSIYYSVIQTAYDAAASGQTVQMQLGNFAENLTLSNPSPVKLSGGYSCNYSTNTNFTTIFGNVIITGSTVTAEKLIISTAFSQPPAPSEPWPSLPPGTVSYISGTSCPVASNLQCSQQISNGPSCLYQSCTCYFSQSGVGDTDSGYWKTFDASGNLTGIFNCETDGGLTALQIREGSCSIMFNSQVETFINNCATCTYSYSDWSACQPDNTQTRTLISSPAGCVGTPVLTQSCTYQPPCCGCYFDVYCSQPYGPGGCWYCHTSTYTSTDTCPLPAGYPSYTIISPGECACDPGLYQVCQ